MDDEPKPQGRPTIFTPELRREICKRLSSGRTLRSVCRDDDMPGRTTVHEWMIDNIGEIVEGEKVVELGFRDHITRAREIGSEEIHDEVIEIADDSTNDYMEIVKKTRNGEKKQIVFDKEAVMRSDLRVRTRLSYLANMQPRKYGKNVKVETQALNAKGEPADPGVALAQIDGYIGNIADAVKQGLKEKE